MDSTVEITPLLKKIGLSDKEIRVYLSCLSLGPSPVRTIAHHADINRGTTHDLLKKLIELGLVVYYHREKHQYFAAENPEKIADIITAREQELAKSKNDILAAIPALQSLFHKAGGKPVVRYYEGQRGIRHILQDVLDTVGKSAEKTYAVYSSAPIRGALYATFADFTKKRIRRNIRVRVIALGAGGDEQPLAERKWLTKKTGAPTYIIIYGDKTAFISFDNAQSPLGVIVEDAATAQTQHFLFDSLWTRLS